MVHLSMIPSDAEAKQTIVEGIEQLRLTENAATVPVYGSHYAGQDLPTLEMAEEAMPREIAYRMIRDELQLDGTPTLNLASFVTTYMEDEAEKLMTMCLPKNFIDYEEYPVSADIQNRCVSMIARLFNAPTHEGEKPIGTSTIGSSEAIMLAVLAMKKRWQKQMKAKGKTPSNPNLIMSSSVQVCWEKAVRYFDVEERFVNCTETRYVLDAGQAVSLIDENTIGICAILGSTYTGEYEDVKALNDLLESKGMDTPIHVDAASGGFVVPFVNPDLVWDFRLSNVVSINTSGHKYGLVYPGVGWCVWRDPEYLPQELVFNINYLGADQASFTLNFSRGASQIIGQYYQLIRLGKTGYRSIMLNITRIADYLSASLEALGFTIMSRGGGKGLPLVAFRLPTDAGYEFDEFAVAHQLRERGWIVPAYTSPPTASIKMMRIVVREDFSRSRCDALLADFKLTLETLKNMDSKRLQMQKEHVKGLNKKPAMNRRATWTVPDNHSLQGKHGKTHGVC